MSYYIYKYIENNEIVYIGQTINLKQRIKQHKNDKLKNFLGDIYYFKCINKAAMDSWEYMLINKYQPLYNIKDKVEEVKINIEEPEWTKYEEKEDLEIKNMSEEKKSSTNFKNIDITSNIDLDSIFLNDSKQPYELKQNFYLIHQLKLVECKIITSFLIKYLVTKQNNLTYAEYIKLIKAPYDNSSLRNEWNSYCKTLADKKLLIKNANSNYYLDIDKIDFEIKNIDIQILINSLQSTTKYFFYFLERFINNICVIDRKEIESFYLRPNDFIKTNKSSLIYNIENILNKNEVKYKENKEGRKVLQYIFET